MPKGTTSRTLQAGKWHSLTRKIFSRQRCFPPRTPITHCKQSQLSKSYVGRGSSWAQVLYVQYCGRDDRRNTSYTCRALELSMPCRTFISFAAAAALVEEQHLSNLKLTLSPLYHGDQWYASRSTSGEKKKQAFLTPSPATPWQAFPESSFSP